MKKIITITVLLLSFLGHSQDKIYRIYLKDGTSKDIIKPKKGNGVVSCESSDGMNSLLFNNSDFYNIRLVSKNNVENYIPIKFSYCELIGVDNKKMFSIKSNLNVMVDYGDGDNEFESGYIIDEKTGKAVTFSSMVEAMNFMGKNGWEFVQAYTVSDPAGGSVYRWLLKRNIK